MIPESMRPSGGFSVEEEWVPTPWVDEQGPIQLELQVFTPSGAGPFPTVVLNHGSTGRGDEPVRFKVPWTSPGLVSYFMSVGWRAVFPQRRGRGRSGGTYDEGFKADRSGYDYSRAASCAAVERALADLEAVMSHVRSSPEVDSACVVMGGTSRGGLLSIAYAGTHPDHLAGVINLAGGWVAEQCEDAMAINQDLFRRGASFPRETLWVYGSPDPRYSDEHCSRNFAAFEQAGGRGRLVKVTPPDGSGHVIHHHPSLWESEFTSYLSALAPRPRTPTSTH